MLQSLILSIGGCLALEELNCKPNCWHLAGSGSAFTNLYRICKLMENKKMDFYTALNYVRSSTIFTIFHNKDESSYTLDTLFKVLSPTLEDMQINVPNFFANDAFCYFAEDLIDGSRFNTCKFAIMTSCKTSCTSPAYALD